MFTEKGLEDFFYWANNNKEVYKKIKELLKDIARNQYFGLGHPKPLSGNKSGWWRRNIDKKHRLVYRIVNDDIIEISQCKDHYDDK